MKVHLHQFLRETGAFKRKKDILLAANNGELRIEDKIIKNPSYRFNPKKFSVYWKGKKLDKLESMAYILVNKPVGYLSTKLTEPDKKMGKKSVFDIIKIDEKTKNSLFSVGRLDEDTSGLLILTNDGKLGFKIAHPKNEIKKTYHAFLGKPLLDQSKIEGGIEIKLEENGKISKYKTKKSKIRKITDKEIFITLTEGKKREVRRIFEAADNKVISLERISIENLSLDLKQGEFKSVDKKFIEDRIFH